MAYIYQWKQTLKVTYKATNVKSQLGIYIDECENFKQEKYAEYVGNGKADEW